MIEIFETLDLKKLTKNQLRDIIKAEAKNIHMKDIMLAASFLSEDAKYMQKSYREDYVERFSKAFFLRIKELKEDKNDYCGYIDIEKLQEFLKVLNQQNSDANGNNEKCFVRIARIIAIYTTFVREEPIHPLGTRFPGGFVLYRENGKYFCPVKIRQLKNPNALCRFCVSIQNDNAL
jgi:uncharacterized protein (UPF0305 family)